jgi:hypothetical protein
LAPGGEAAADDESDWTRGVDEWIRIRPVILI